MKCKYSLVGLAEGSLCPECGADWPRELPAFRPTLKERLPVARFIVIGVLIINATSLLIFWLGARWLLAWAYVDDGFTFETGWRVAPKRELADFSSYLGRSLAWLWVLLAPTPLLALHPSRRVALRAFAVIVVLAVSITIVNLL